MADIIQAAGGVVSREGPGGREILVVHRRRYGDWSLPKGKRKPGETLRQTASREVREETGYRVQLAGKAGEVHYSVQGTPKVVSFWHMRAVGKIPHALPDPEEVQEAVWLPPEDALKKLTYALERELLARVVQAGKEGSA